MIKCKNGKIDVKGMWAELLTDTLAIIDFMRGLSREDSPALCETLDNAILEQIKKGGKDKCL